jgi:arylsulfatase A-like enzyme
MRAQIFGVICVLQLTLGLLAESRPNIIVIVADDPGFSDLGCYGGEIKTPNLDTLAANGIRLTQFYNNAKCTQTRAALLTGLYNHQSNNLKEPNAATIAEVLKQAEYSTLMSGKWHVGFHTEDRVTPNERGFDRYFGFLSGAINFFTGEDYSTGRNLMRLNQAVYNVPQGFYSTDAFTDYAIEFIDQAGTQKQPNTNERSPFFLYLAHNAPHFPLQALPEDIARYRKTYHGGWDALRKQRHAKMIEMGLVDSSWPLSDRDPYAIAWDNLNASQKIDQQELMAVYAAMVDRLDQNIGRLMSHLDSIGESDNTVIFFFSDNGGCPYDFDQTPGVSPGPSESRRSYNSPWANASNTPFRLYKQWAHEGGISTPCIVSWPKGIPERLNGSINHSTAHLIDVMPTCLELGDATYPKNINGNPLPQLEGLSMASIFKGETRKNTKPIFWEFSGHHAMRQGKWKLVAESGHDWELYDIKADRTEMNNLAATQSDRAEEMANAYNKWANRIGAKTHAQCILKGPSTQSR